MRHLLAILSLISGTFFSDSQSFQSSSEITAIWRDYAQRGDNLISDIRPKFRQALEPADRALEASLEYEIVVTGNTNAFAQRSRRTILTSSFLQIIDSMATMMAAAQTFNKPECLGNYIQYLGEGTRNNSWLVGHGNQPKPVAMAFGYWRLRPDICGGLTESKFRANKQADDLREFLIYSSLIYLIGHEFCHHKYHDNLFRVVSPEDKSRHARGGLDVSHEVTPAEQSEKELRADLFAFRKMISMDYPPMTAMPVLVFFMGVEGFSPEQTDAADHPAAVVRFEEMISATKDDPEFMPLIKAHHMEQQWQQFEELGKMLQKDD